MGFAGVPDWAAALLGHYAAAGRLVAHGVEMSLLTVGQRARRERWMAFLDGQLARYRFAHLTEHHGLMTAGAMVGGTPLPHPRSPAAVAVGGAPVWRSFASTRGSRSASRTSRSRSRDATWRSSQTSSRQCSSPTGSCYSISTTCFARRRASASIRTRSSPSSAIARSMRARAACRRRLALRAAPGRADASRRSRARGARGMLRPPRRCALARCPGVSWVVLEHADGMLRTPAHMEWRSAPRSTGSVERVASRPGACTRIV